MFALIHEAEHALQFLIANNKVPFKYDEVKEGYKNLTDILKGRDYILPHPITMARDLIAKINYYKNDINYVFERNANIEACNDVSLVANSLEDFDIARAFYIFSLTNSIIGYIENTNGSMWETYKNLHILDKFKKVQKDDNIPEDERLRFGLSVDEATRKVLLKEIEKFK